MRPYLMTILAGTIASSSFADIIEWDGGGVGNAWSTATNWAGDVLPGADDRVLIEGNVDVHILDNSEITIDSIEIGTDATLSIREEVVLTIENDDKNITCSPPPSPSCSLYDNHLIDGLILFPADQDDGGTIKFVKSPHIIGGAGTIRSGEFVATIEIDGDVRVTNLLDGTDAFGGDGGIRGTMHIVGNTGTSFDGTFSNKGLVISDAPKPGILITAEIEDDDTSRYVVSDCTNFAVAHWIEFTKGSIALDGDFIDLGGGEFRFHDDMHTCGTYGRFKGAEESCGGIEILDTEITFRYLYFDTDINDPCGNPGTLAPVSMSCGTPWKVDSNVTIEDPCGF